jgi:transcriptional regulator with XRE-family HTH domain
MDNLESVLIPLGTAIRKRRKAKNLTQASLAQLAGLHRTFIADVERGARNISIMTLVRIATALNTSVSGLCSVLPKTPPVPPDHVPTKRSTNPGHPPGGGLGKPKKDSRSFVA